MAVLVLKVLPQREAAIKGETARSPREGGVTGASSTAGVGEGWRRAMDDLLDEVILSYGSWRGEKGCASDVRQSYKASTVCCVV